MDLSAGVRRPSRGGRARRCGLAAPLGRRQLLAHVVRPTCRGHWTGVVGDRGCSHVAERIWPAQHRSPVARGYRQDALYTILNATVTLPLVTALSLSFSEVVRSRMAWLTFPRLSVIPHAMMIAVIFVALDGCNWAVHLANHRIEALWRFHELPTPKRT